MADIHTKNQRSKNMAAIRGKNNKSTELVIVSLLRKEKIRGWRRHNRSLPGTPDFIFPENKIAIFVDGCFWHGCKKCFVPPKTNQRFWINKITDNRKRDKRVSNTLREKGWQVHRFWEHEIKKNSLDVMLKTGIMDKLR